VTIVVVVMVMVVVVPIMVVMVIVVVPVTLVVFPTAVIAVVMRMGPIPTLEGRLAPPSGYPDIPGARPAPVSIDPGIARTWHLRPDLITQRWRSSADVDTDLGEGWSRNC
jgi:hypothetical protein